MTQDFSIHDVLVRQVTFFPLSGGQQKVTRVSMYVGAHGPFTQDFGPGQQFPDTPAAINSWKQQQVTFVQAAASQ